MCKRPEFVPVAVAAAEAKKAAAAKKKAEAKEKAKAAVPGYLIIASRPSAKVYVDGRNTRRVTPIRPSSPLKLSPGSHRITLVAQGQRFNFSVKVTSRETTRLVRVLPLR